MMNYVDSIKSTLLDNVRKALVCEDIMDDYKAKEIITEKLFSDKRSLNLSDNEIDGLINSIFYKTRSKLGIIKPLMDDPDVNEIMVNGPDCIFFEKAGNIKRYEYTFDSVQELEDVIRNIASDVHREINELNPIVDARLEDGSRVNGVYKNIAINGPILTIRKFSERYMTLHDLTGNGTLTLHQAEVLKALVICGYNIFISGGTSSGKTTLLNAICEAIPKNERVIVIEDSAELKLGSIQNIVHMECRNANSQGKGIITMSDLIRTSLRMRPDRIIVGEVRGTEVCDMLGAMNTGHNGSLSTGHGNSVSGMLKRLESMYLMSVTLNIDVIRNQISEGIDIMVHIEKNSEGKRRIVEMKELIGYENGEFIFNDMLDQNCTGIKQINKALAKGDKYVEILDFNNGCRDYCREDLL